MHQQGQINFWVCLGVRTILHVERGGWKGGKEKSEDFMEEVVRLGCSNRLGNLICHLIQKMNIAYFYIRCSVNICPTYVNLTLLCFFPFNLLLSDLYCGCQCDRSFSFVKIGSTPIHAFCSSLQQGAFKLFLRH